MPDPIGIRGRSYERYSMRGRVTGRRGGGAPAGASSDVLMLKDSRGRAQVLSIEPWGGGVGEGHEVTAVWLVRPDRGSGPYVAVRDHSTGEIKYNDAALARLHRPGWVLGAGLAGGILLRFSLLGVGFALFGIACWWLAGLHGRRNLKASGALIGMDAEPAAEWRRGTGHLHRP